MFWNFLLLFNEVGGARAHSEAAALCFTAPGEQGIKLNVSESRRKSRHIYIKQGADVLQ